MPLPQIGLEVRREGGAATDYLFEYGLDTSYGDTTPVKSAGSGSANGIARCAVQLDHCCVSGDRTDL